MKKLLMFAFFPWFFIAFAYKVMAQDEMGKGQKDKKEAEEIIIRKQGGKDVTLNVEINGDKIMINGKPIAEYHNDEVTVNKRKMIIRNGEGKTFMFNDDDDDNEINIAPPATAWSGNDGGAFLGVTTEKTDDGAKITEEVSKESAAGKAGLQQGDIITKLDDKKIDGPASLFEAVNAKKPKDEVKVNFKRVGKEKTATVILGERKTSFSKSYSYSSPDGSFKTYTMPFAFGGDNMKNLQDLKELQQLHEQMGEFNKDFSFPRQQKLGLKIQDTEDAVGVKILEVADSSAAATAGLKKDDIITEIGGEKVSNTDEAREQLQENSEKAAYSIKAKRGGGEMNFMIKIPKKLKTTNL